MNYQSIIESEAAIRKIPLKKLAKSVNVTKSILIHSIRNDKLNIHQLQIICKELGIEISELFVRQQPKGANIERKSHLFTNKLFC